MPKNRQMLIIYLFLSVTTVLAYWQVGNHEFVSFDDDIYVSENRQVQNGITTEGLYWAFTTGHSANWHPLTWISHMLDIQFFGLAPRWHHLTNLLFHIANVLLLFFVLSRMSGAILQSAFVSALFALHPLHVESVAWVAERKDVLSTFFWMLTLIAYSYYVKRPRLKGYLSVLACFALGLMAKPMLVTLPFVLLLLDYWPLERFAKSKSVELIQTEPEPNSAVQAHRKKGKSKKQTPQKAVATEETVNPAFQWALFRPLVVEKIPLFILSALSCFATYIAQNKSGAIVSVEIYTPAARMGNAIVSCLMYIAKTIWPDNLAVLYPHHGSLPLWQVLGAALFLVAVTFAVFRSAKRFPYLPVGWLWFTGTLVPVIGIVQVGIQAMADRYSYIPSIGLFIMAAWGIPKIFKKWRHGKELLAASSALCLTGLLILTWIQVGYWRNSMTLYDHTLNVTENNYTIYNNRARIYQDLGDYARAIADFDRTIQINPGYAPAYNNRGNARKSLGNYTQAVEDFDRAVQINPLYADAYDNRGVAYNGTGNYLRAIEDFNKAIEIKSGFAQFYNDRGVSYMALGNTVRGFEDFSRALETDPHYPEAYFNRGIFYQSSGKYRQAIDDYDKAVENNTVYNIEALCNRGTSYSHLGEQVNAIKDFDKAIQINPGCAEAYYKRGKAYAALGRHEQSLEDSKKAAKLGYEDARMFLKSQGIAW